MMQGTEGVAPYPQISNIMMGLETQPKPQVNHNSHFTRHQDCEKQTVRMTLTAQETLTEMGAKPKKAVPWKFRMLPEQ